MFYIYAKYRSERRRYKWNIFMVLLIIVVFTCIIFSYYMMNYTSSRNTIIKDGEAAAGKTADSIGLFLATNMDTVRLAAYALDEMITKDRSNEDIQDFLERQSAAKKIVIDPDSTGFYAYINGKFFSGNIYRKSRMADGEGSVRYAWEQDI